jgi:hypothetical protein
MEAVMEDAAILASMAAKQQICNELEAAAAHPQVGKMVAKHEKLILQYYEDVLTQAKQSFDSAKFVAKIGFWVLIGTVVYVLVTDVLAHTKTPGFSIEEHSKTVSVIGVVSGALIEFVAGVNFWLYSRVSKQFAAFHICLERTHRYLLAYSIADQVTNQKDEIFGKLVCIMANAPMITSRDLPLDLARAEQAPAVSSLGLSLDPSEAIHQR